MTLRRAAAAATAAFASVASVAWTPLPGPQTVAVESEAMQTGYGGQAGGGKSDTLLGIPLTYHQKAIIYRREYPQLRGLVARSREIIGYHGRYNGSEHTWRLKDGRTLEFASVPHEDSVSKYQGQPHDYIGFDEVQHFTESQVRFLLGWLRSATPGQRVRCVMTFNPPTTVEGQWIVGFFGPWLDPKHPRPAVPGEIRFFAMVNGEEVDVHPVTGELLTGDTFTHKDETIRPVSRTFIRAALSDNPYLEDSGYRATLQALPEPLRSQMLLGDFLAGVEDDAWQLIPTSWVKSAMERHKAGRPHLADGKLSPMTALGADLACGGRDKTVLAPLYGSWFGPFVVRSGKETPDGESAARLIIGTLGQSSVRPNVDTIGIGQGARTALAMQGVRFNDVNFAAAAYGRSKGSNLAFVNVRAEAYWLFREALDPESGCNIALPDDRELLAELCAVVYELTGRGIQLGAKDKIKDRLGRSPDKADAVVLAWYKAAVAGYGQNPF